MFKLTSLNKAGLNMFQIVVLLILSAGAIGLIFLLGQGKIFASSEGACSVSSPISSPCATPTPSPISAPISPTPTPKTDTTAPKCINYGSGYNSQGEKYIQLAFGDKESGFKSFSVINMINAYITSPNFTVGTTEPVVVTVTKIVQNKPSKVWFLLTDIAGNQSVCSR